MENNSEVFNLLIDFESSISEVYMEFSRIFPDDKEFWWRIAMEEKNHASIIQSGRDVFNSMGLFPVELTSLSIDYLKLALAEKKALLSRIKEQHQNLTRKKAVAIAIKIEESDIENIFQELMKIHPDLKSIKVFQTLNKETCDHAVRLLRYLDSI